MENEITIDELLQRWINHSFNTWNKASSKDNGLNLTEVRAELDKRGISDLFITNFQNNKMEIRYSYRGNKLQKEFTFI